MKCIAVGIALIGMAYIMIGMLELAGTGHAPPVGIILLGGLIFIPLMLQYYALNSISVVLKLTAELHEKVEALQKMLERMIPE